jgi:hypothetical protein
MKMKMAIKWLSCMLIPVIYWKKEITMKQNMEENSVYEKHKMKTTHHVLC